VKASDFDGIVIPGGYAPDHIRRHPEAIQFVKDMNDRGGLLAAICHGPWVLCSTPALRNRTVTCFFAIKDDVINAAASMSTRKSPWTVTSSPHASPRTSPPSAANPSASSQVSANDMSPEVSPDGANMTSAISVQNLQKNYGDVEAVRGIDFDVSQGEVFGLLGPTERAKPPPSRSSKACVRAPAARRLYLVSIPASPSLRSKTALASASRPPTCRRK